ncbi:MAG: septation protein SepH [Actinomycetaceae bacterium]|nr:septation protein SepH [Actinomycetaceae bacterium]MDY6083090.1 septation protein SepH [Actinomycetaceae bacterium]
MKDLQLLGIAPDGTHLMLFDDEGSRYSLAITDELRHALRRDAALSVENPALRPRDIQAMIREGLSIDDVAAQSGLSPDHIDVLANPILKERRYIAQLAKDFPLTMEVGSLSVEELTASRLLSLGVEPETITWDATKRGGKPWQVSASFIRAGENYHAVWDVDTNRRTLRAANDVARWISETTLSDTREPGDVAARLTYERNTERNASETTHAEVRRDGHIQLFAAPVASLDDARKAAADDAQTGDEESKPMGSSEAQSDSSSSDATHVTGSKQPTTGSTEKINRILASLDAQRGTRQPMPGLDTDEDDPIDQLTGLASVDPTRGDPTQVVSLVTHQASSTDAASLRHNPHDAHVIALPTPHLAAVDDPDDGHTAHAPADDQPGAKSHGAEDSSDTDDGQQTARPASQASTASLGSTASHTSQAARNSQTSQGIHTAHTGNSTEQESLDGSHGEAPQSSKKKKKKRSGRPQMPSWDDIVFGPARR